MLSKSLSLLTGPLMARPAADVQRGRRQGVSWGTERAPPAMGSSRRVEGGGYREIWSFSGCELREPLGERVGRVSRVFVDPSGHAAQVEVAMGPFGTSAQAVCPRRTVTP